MTRLLALALLFCLTLTARAQEAAPKGHRLIVFAENGEKFFLILEGRRINEVPAARVVWDGLPKSYYKAKVIFDDERLPATDGNIQLEGVDNPGGFNEVTYMLRRKEKKGKIEYVFRVAGWQELSKAGSSAVSQTTPVTPVEATVPTEPTEPVEAVEVTETTGNVTDTHTMVVQMPGAPAVILPAAQTTVTTTTVSTTKSSGKPVPVRQPAPAPGKKATPIKPVPTCQPPADLSEIRSAIAAESFSENRMNVAKQILGSTCLTTQQVKDLAPLFTMEEDRLEFVKTAYLKVTDKANYWKLNSAFTFSASKEGLDAFLKAQK